MNLIITDEDIKKAERIFLKSGQSFDKERMDFIKCVDKSLHVQACPGSGKTTALLAKLYILSEKMPFENNRGICVLTHTNVAINLIKSKLGEKANILFSYPNFFGTIQSFVDKYLAIPAYIKCFKHKLKYIDNEVFRNKLNKCSNMINNNTWLERNRPRHFDNNVDYVANMKVSFDNMSGPSFKLDIKISDNTKTYKKLSEIFNNFFSEGYIRFEDSYSLSKIYIETFPEIKNLFSSRFPFVFIDEAQDTSVDQRKIIEDCFNENVIIQWIGDTNQGIMNNDEAETGWEPVKDSRFEVINFNNSHRISQPIADLVKGVALYQYDSLNGISEITQKPILIVFNDNTVGSVLDKFAELIVTKLCKYGNEDKTIWEISKLTGNPIKAVGWVGKEKQNGLSIKSYYKDFEKKLTISKRIHFPNLYTMYCTSKSLSPKEFKNRTMYCILEALYLSDIKSPQQRRFSKTEFFEYLENIGKNLNNDLLSIVSKYYSVDNFYEYSNQLIKLLKGVGFNLNCVSEKYLNENKMENVSITLSSSNFNIFSKNINGKDVEILLDTVHGVKGETHTATLYLETKYKKNSLEYVKKELFDHSSEQEEKNEQALKITYVAFSRPTHLLCIAIHNGIFQKLNNTSLYEIIDLT